MPSATITRDYRARRRDGWRAREAFSWARNEDALQAAEADGLVIVRVVGDDDYQPFGEDEIIADETDGLNSGRYQVYGVRVYVPDTCAHCGHAIATPADEIDVGYNNDPKRWGWTEAGAIWGIVVENSDDPYLRSVAHDLAHEADVLPYPKEG